MKKILYFWFSGWLAVALTGCAVKAPSSIGAREEIKKALQDSLATNRRLASSAININNSPLERVLTPELEVMVGRQRKIIDTDPRFDVVVNNLDAKVFFQGLVKDTKFNIIIDEAISGLITLNLHKVTLNQVMEALRDAYGFEFERTGYGFRVFPRKLITKVFKVDYIDVARSGNSHTTLSASQQVSKGGASSNGSGDSVLNTGGTIDTENDGKFWEVLKENLNALVDQSSNSGAMVAINPKAGTVIAKAYPNELRAIEKYLTKVQAIVQRQVIIEAKILEVALNAEFHSGIDWQLFGFHQKTPGSSETLTGTTSLFVQATSGTAFKAAIDLLNYQGDVNVLSSPRIATLNNQKAVIKVGSDRFFITDIGSDVNTSSGGSVTSSSMTLTPFFSGISLDVTPQIDEDDNVTIHIHPIISTVSDDVRNFTVDGKTQSLPLARSEVRESDSVVRAKNGQVIVIGGLMKSNSSLSKNSTPGLDQVPVLNAAFKTQTRTSGKFELVILLKPMIATNNNWQKQLKEAAINLNNMGKEGSYRYELKSAKALENNR